MMYLKVAGNLLLRVIETGLCATAQQGLRDRQKQSSDVLLRETRRGSEHLAKKWNLIKND